MLLEPDLINQGLILTAIGIGTAFGLLVVMMLLIHIMSWFVNIPVRRANKAKQKAELESIIPKANRLIPTPRSTVARPRFTSLTFPFFVLGVANSKAGGVTVRVF